MKSDITWLTRFKVNCKAENKNGDISYVALAFLQLSGLLCSALLLPLALLPVHLCLHPGWNCIFISFLPTFQLNMEYVKLHYHFAGDMDI